MPWTNNRNSNNLLLDKPKDFTDVDKSEFLNNVNLLNNFEKKKREFPFLEKALDDFFLTAELSDFSVFKIVSYIACLELVLVDNSHDRLKSINVQLQRKVSLINNQLKKPIKVADYFKGPNTLNIGSVMGVLYDYRSSVAHGDFIDFSKKLQILDKVYEDQILKLLRDILKQVLIFAIKNPDLVSDLKKC